jgi:DNA polymerase (family 10)
MVKTQTEFTNLQIAELLRRVAAAYLITGENRFTIMAYERAADSIEHLTSETKDYWHEGKLNEISGVGKALASHLDELFVTGESHVWKEVLGKVPQAIFPLLLVPGLGPKKAYALVKNLGLKNEKTVIADLEKAALAGKISTMEHFGEQSQKVILDAIETYKRGQIKENRMPLPYADTIAHEVMDHIVKGGEIEKIDVLGSLRRQVATIGDIDIAAATDHPESVVERFVSFPHQRIIDQGPKGATLLLTNGRQVDLRVQKPQAFGAMLQYFTGSKNHNIHLRELALKKGLSLNEHGIKDVQTGKITEYETEEQFYSAIGLTWIPPEMREDRGEIDLAKTDNLPHLVELKNMRGDLHIHSDYDLSSSHDVGSSSIAEYLDRACELGYVYVGFSDHNPRTRQMSEQKITDIMKKRYDHYHHIYEKWLSQTHNNLKMFVMCEVDIQPNGSLALPSSAFEYVDAVIVSIHSAFMQDRTTVTERLIKALTSNPKVRILGHPTGRLLGSREGVNADWNRVFDIVQKRDIALEINAYPERLDLPDNLVYDAVKRGIKLVIDTDSHAVQNMDLMPYGVAVARRGWAEKKDIMNTYSAKAFETWLRRE